MAERTIKVAAPITGEEEAAAIRDVVLSGNFVSGRKVSEFEEAFGIWQRPFKNPPRIWKLPWNSGISQTPASKRKSIR